MLSSRYLSTCHTHHHLTPLAGLFVAELLPLSCYVYICTIEKYRWKKYLHIFTFLWRKHSCLVPRYSSFIKNFTHERCASYVFVFNKISALNMFQTLISYIIIKISNNIRTFHISKMKINTFYVNIILSMWLSWVMRIYKVKLPNLNFNQMQCVYLSATMTLKDSESLNSKLPFYISVGSEMWCM